MPSGGNAQQKMRKSWQKMRPSRTSYRAMEGLPTVELRCPSRLLCSIPPPPLPGALWIPPPSRIIGWPRVSSMTTGHAARLKASRPSRGSEVYSKGRSASRSSYAALRASSSSAPPMAPGSSSQP